MEDFETPSVGKVVGYGCLFLVVLFILALIGSAWGLISIPWLKFDSQVNMNRGIITKTYNADNALYNYHWFQERSQALIALQAKIKIAQQSQTDFETIAGIHSSWTYEDKTEDSRLRTVTQGLQSQYQDLAGEYNARAGEVDRAIFKDGLPLFFNLNAY